MIPLKIQIKNFLSYGPNTQTIDFSAYSLICLSGKNGHGKSALLDAMTWALWGQARKTHATARADNGLLRIGQSTMLVVFDFICNGTHYRIRREYGIVSGKSFCNLDFGIISPTNTISPLSDKTIRATQDKIIKTLHLDYDAFVNSAFLRQGQSNEFSKKSAKERKEILATILGLAQYEQLRKQASEKVRLTTAQKEHMLALQTHQRDIGSLIEQTQQQHTNLDTQLESFSRQEHALHIQEQELAKQKTCWREQQQQVQALENKISHMAQTVSDQKDQLSKLIKQWRSIHSQLYKAPNQSHLEQEYNRLIAQLSLYQTQAHHILQLKETLLLTKEQLNQHIQHIKAAHQQTLTMQHIACERLSVEFQNTTRRLQEAQQQELLQQEHATRLHKQIEDGMQTIKDAVREHASIQTFTRRFDRRKEFYQRYVTCYQLLKQELDQIAHKTDLVNNEQDPSCPLCEQNLSLARKRFLKKKFDDNTQALKHRLTRLTHLLSRLKALLLQDHAQFEKIQQDKDSHNRLVAQHDALQQQYEQVMQACTVTQNLKEQLTSTQLHITQTLTQAQTLYQQLELQTEKAIIQNSTYQELSGQITAREKEIHGMSYDATAHSTARAQLDLVEKQRLTLQTLREQQAVQEQRYQNITNAIAYLRKLKDQLKNLKKEQQRYAHLAQEDEYIKTREHTLKKELTDLINSKQMCLENKGRVQQQLSQLLVQQQEAHERQKTIDQLNLYIADYQLIANATSKDGIQALLIEQAIPEIEQEANYILAKLTDNQAHLTIESIRDLKKGSSKETLDINISDNLGIRPYELFSGGEAFRIDFALRIGLSKLLAHRAGATLQTLIIDEGFGSQDEDGLSHIMEALYKIQSDFEKIIIVSHLPTLKDQFPVHFVVEKSSQGSIVHVEEHA